MFEHLDDTSAPASVPLDDVVRRGRQLRARRRAAFAGVAVLAVVAGISAAAALQGPTAKKVTVTAPPTSTTVREPAAGATRRRPTTTTTTVRRSGPTTPTSLTPPVTAPPHDPHDYSMLSVTYAGNGLNIDAGAGDFVSYIVSNAGSWGVEWTARACPASLLGAGAPPTLWSPYTTIWPQPVAGYPACTSGAGTVERLAPGETREISEPVIAGAVDANGSVFPAKPGFTWFRAAFLSQCGQPCESPPANSLAVTVWPPGDPGSYYKLRVASDEVDAPPGGAVNVRVTYTNPLDFAVRMPIYGPCWRVESAAGAVDCSGSTPAVTVGPKSTTRLVGTVYARTNFTATGRPLSTGRYRLKIADRVESDQVYLVVR